MSSKSESEDLAILKTDVLGRVKRTQTERDAIVDAFEASALSGAQFAERHGLNYQTFMTWRRQRRKRLELDAPHDVKNDDFTFLEVSTERPVVDPDAIVINVGNQVKIEVSSHGQIELAASLIKELSSS